MKIGVPREIMTGEGRVALTPTACKTLVDAGHALFVQSDAGLSSGYVDAEYRSSGSVIVETAQSLYQQAQLIIKVKQPLADDLVHLAEHHVIFSYCHLAADPALVQALCDTGASVIPFESVMDAEGALPLLTPMSQVAGRIAVMRGASLLFRNRGGRGVLLGGIEGSEPGRVLVLGAGVAGSHAVAVAAALGAHVDVLDLDETKLQRLQQQHTGIETHLSTAEQVEVLSVNADLVIGAVLLAGRRAPVVLHQSVVKQMHEGSVIVDIAIDQGGCVEGIRMTDSEELCYHRYGVIHSAVPNMPAAVPRTSSQSLSSAILPYVRVLADFDLAAKLAISAADQPVLNRSADNNPAGNKPALDECEGEALQHENALLHAVAIHRGSVVDAVLAAEIQS